MSMDDRPRILLGLKAGEILDESISLAARLAATLEAAVHGLLVEEDALFDAAGLPFTRIVTRGGTTAPEFTVSAVQRAFGEAERLCRQSLATMAQASRVPWTMQCERGEIAACLSAHAQAGDIVVVPDAGGHGLRRQVLATARLVASHTQGVVIAGRGGRAPAHEGGPVLAIDEGGPAGQAVVSFAARLAAGLNRPLHVLAIAASAEAAGASRKRAGELAGGKLQLRHSWLPAGNAAPLARRLAALAPSLLVADIGGGMFGDDTAIMDVQRAAGAPLVLLSGGGGEVG